MVCSQIDLGYIGHSNYRRGLLHKRRIVRYTTHARNGSDIGMQMTLVEFLRVKSPIPHQYCTDEKRQSSLFPPVKN